MLSASRTLHSSVHLVKAVGILERVPTEHKGLAGASVPINVKQRICGRLTSLSSSAALLMEEVIQQLIIRTGNNVHILVTNQEAGTTARLQRQRA